jgi:hypothetical protein
VERRTAPPQLKAGCARLRNKMHIEQCLCHDAAGNCIEEAGSSC